MQGGIMHVSHIKTPAPATMMMLSLLSLFTVGIGGCQPISSTSPGAHHNQPYTADQLKKDSQRYSQYQANATGNAQPGNDVQWISNSPPAAVASASPNPTAVDTPNPTPTITPQKESQPAKATAPPPLTSEQLIAKLADSMKTPTDSDVTPYIRRAALAVLDPTKELKEEDLAALSPQDRRVVLAWQQTFAQLGQSGMDRAKLEDLANKLTDQLASQRTLRLSNVKLCSKVNGYGVYDEFPKYTFLAGAEHPMIVYAELANFADQTTSDGKHQVKLTQEVVIYNQSDGLPVWRHQPVQVVDESFNRRRDFFVVQIIRLSDRLTVGKYNMKVTVTDEIGNTVDEATIPFSIVADPQLTQ
jgi:hypothetical protein